jgi:hypothetical protein
MGHRIVSLSHWRNGDLKAAKVHADAAMKVIDANAASAMNTPFVYKQSVSARGNYSNLLWLVGSADQAQTLAEEAIASGLSSDVVGLCYSLSHTLIPLAFWCGDWERAKARAALLQRLSRESDLGQWYSWGRCYDAILHALEQDRPDQIPVGTKGMLQRHIIATVSGTPLDDEIAISDDVHWCTAELLRLKGVAHATRGEIPIARTWLECALETAINQGALAWELRAATSMARLELRHGSPQLGYECLAPVLDRFREGFHTRDLVSARELLSVLRGHESA